MTRGRFAPRAGPRLWVALAIAGTLTCGEGGTEPVNKPPAAVGRIPDQVVAVDSAVVVDVRPYFADPDGDTLVHAATSSSAATAAVAVSGSMVTVTGVAAGSASVTVTARDPEGLTAEQVFGVTVPNRAPAAVGTIADQSVYVDGTATIDVAEHFTDPDGDLLAYAATSSDTSRVAVEVAGAAVTVTGMAVGGATVTVTAADPGGLAAEQVFEVTVPNRAPRAVDTIEDRVVEVDSVVVVDVAAYFADPDRDSLAYSAASSDATRATVAMSGSVLTVTGSASGAATVTVTAADPGGLTAGQVFGVAVPNRPPVVSDRIGDREVHVGDTVVVDLARYFADPDGDALQYAATSSDTGRASVSVSGSMVAISGVAVGSTTVAVTASDTAGLEARQSFGVTIPNRPPVPVGMIADRNVHVGDTVAVDVAAYFTDPDGQKLQYAAGSSSEVAVTVAVSGSTVTVSGGEVGGATVTVTAEDPGGLRAEQVFGVTVPNRAPLPVGTIADREVEVDSVGELDVARYFAEPDGQLLEYSAASSNPDRAAVTVSGSTMTVTGVAAGRTTVTVRATDPGGLRAEQRFEVLVPNRAPLAVGTIGDRVVFVDDTFAVNVAGYFSDPDGDTLVYAAASSDTARARVSVSGSVMTVRGAGVGNATVTVTARDPEGLAAEQRFAVSVPNRAPRAVGTIPDAEVHVRGAVTVDLAGYFSDPDGEELEYTAVSSSPETAAAKVSARLLTVAGVAVGNLTVTVTARDPGGLAAGQRFRVTVPNRPPRAVGTIPDAVLVTDSLSVIDVAEYFTDPDGQVLRYSAVSSDSATATATVSAATMFLEGVAQGTATVTVTARDPGELTAEQTFRLTVPNRPPVAVGAIADREVEAGNSEAVDVVAYFRDPDGDELRYGATSSDAARVAVSASGGVVTVRGVAGGSETVTVTATDPGGSAAEQNFVVTVPNRAPEPVGAMDHQVFEPGTSLRVGVSPYFADPDGDALTYAATSSNTAVATVEVSGDTVIVAGDAEGTATITVTARDPGGLTATQRFDATVEVPNNPPEPVGTIPGRTIDAGEELSIDVEPYFRDPDGDELEYEAMSSGDAIATADMEGAARLVVTGQARGEATITVTATDPGGLAAVQEFDVEVPNRAPEPAGTMDDLFVEPGTSLWAEVSPYFTDPDGDALTYAATSSNTAVATVEVSGDTVIVAGDAEGTATITVTARDPGGLTATQRFDATVEVPNNPPEPVGTIPGRTIDAGEELSIDVEPYFRDPDGDELEYEAMSSGEEVATAGMEGAARLVVTGQARGEATITVTATDPGGLAAVQEFDVEVPNQAPYVDSGIEDLLDATPGERYRAVLTSVFVDPDGDPLAFRASSSDTDVAETEIRGDTIYMTAVDVGTATITVTATDSAGLSATDEFEFKVIPARFDIELLHTSDVTDTLLSLIGKTRDEWTSILYDTELDDVRLPDPIRCLDIVAPNVGVVDDHLVLMDVREIDGVGGTLAYAGYCYRRASDGSPIVSAAVFDEADVDTLIAYGTTEDVIFHEIAHGLGFISTYWDYKDLLETGDDPHFEGELAIEAFDDAGGEDYDDEKVPISSPDHSHWRKSVFGTEGMTPSLRLGVKNPFSAITLQAMADIDYEVDVSLADDYELPGNSAPPPGRPGDTARVLDLSNDVAWTPVTVLGPDGTIIRVIRPPPGPETHSFGLLEATVEDRLRPARPEGTIGIQAQGRRTMWRLVR